MAVYYNGVRLHSTVCNNTPMEYENSLKKVAGNSCPRHWGEVDTTLLHEAVLNQDDLDQKKMERTVNVSMNIRNAIHGLEVWPY